MFMEYKFNGIITSFKHYKIPFKVNERHLLLDVSDVSSRDINYTDANGNEIFSGVPHFNQEYLEGQTDDGLVIKLHIHSYYDGEQYYGHYEKAVHYIYGNIISCIVLEKDIVIDKIGFFSYEIEKITGQSFRGALTEDQLKMFGHDGSLAEYTENGHKYFVGYDFLKKKPFINSQVIAIKSNEPLSQIMMEDVYWTARKFLAFIYQRKEVPIIDVVLFSNDSVVGHLFIQKHLDENKFLFGVKCFQVNTWENKLNNLFQALVDKKIYLRHLPSFEKEKNDYTISRFLMTVVGFESTLNICKIKAEHSDEHKAAILAVKEQINSLVDSSTGETKREYKRLVKTLREERFSDKVISAINDNADYISNFYDLRILGNNTVAIAEKMSKYRNSFAHGDLDEDLSEEHANQCIFLDFFILYLQLIYIGFNKKEASQMIPFIMFEH